MCSPCWTHSHLQQSSCCCLKVMHPHDHDYSFKFSFLFQSFADFSFVCHVSVDMGVGMRVEVSANHRSQIPLSTVGLWGLKSGLQAWPANTSMYRSVLSPRPTFFFLMPGSPCFSQADLKFIVIPCCSKNDTLLLQPLQLARRA